jgi:MFS family permease
VSDCRSWYALAISAMAVFLVFLDTTVLYVAFPDLRATFEDVSPAALSWVLNSYTIAAALLIPAGRLADRIGRKRVFLSSVAMFCLGSALCGVAHDPVFLVASRIVQAVGAVGPTVSAGPVDAFTHVSVEPNWVGDVVPGTLLTGLGVALCLPQLSSAAVQGLPADVFAAGSAVAQVCRQLGATLGIAVAVALIGQPSVATLDRFQRVWLLVISCGVLVSLAAVPLRRPSLAPPTAPLHAVAR